MDKVLPHVQLEDVVLETDCPYLAPTPHRGKRNEPVYLPLIARRVAELVGKPVEDVAAVTSKNALDLFKL